MNEQQKIMAILNGMRPIKSREFVRAGCSWDFRKNICRLVKKGNDIRNISKPGEEGVYQLFAERG